jgi:hypothetical protein
LYNGISLGGENSKDTKKRKREIDESTPKKKTKQDRFDLINQSLKELGLDLTL